MSQKQLIFLAALATILLVLIGFGLSACYATEEISPPIFAFASDRTGSGDIFALDQSGQLLNLTNHPQADWQPAWSPDGRMLAFTSHRSGDSDIWLLPATAVSESTQPQEPPRNLTNHPAWDYSPAWSPSGQSIVFVSERDGDPEIFIQNSEGDTAIQLTFNEGLDHRPAWSPDGKYIAFAAVRNGAEEIYRIRPDGTDEQLVTAHPIQGTSPAWSADSQQIAFIGWDENNRAGIYTIGPQVDDLKLLYQSSSWLGSLNWSADGRWLTFTSWEAGNHELYALPLTGEPPTRLTINPAWDDFLVINPAQRFSATSSGGIAQAAGASQVPAVSSFAAGVNMADLGKAYLVNDLGFNWAKGYVNWATVEPEPGQFRWVDPDNVVKAFTDQQLNILLRIHGTPTWARPADSSLSHPPTDLTDFANFVTELATRYRGQVAAYEIWNEPNLNYEWGNQQPDPAAYTAMLKAAYTAIKSVDPGALVISGGLATTGNGSPTAYGDLDFLQAMYDAGARGYFDALGSHPYAYGLSPAESHPDGLSFDRVVDQHELMVANGDAATPIWITEVGWVLRTHWDLGEHATIGVSEVQQAQYLSQAYAIVENDWPFVEAMFLFNLDFSTVPWYAAAEPMRWYAILNPDGTPRPAYTSLRLTRR